MSYAQNANQNYFVQGGRTTSRVLQQPGGGSSLSLGWETPGSDDRFGNNSQNTAPSRFNSRSNQKEVTGKIGSLPVQNNQYQSTNILGQPQQQQQQPQQQQQQRRPPTNPLQPYSSAEPPVQQQAPQQMQQQDNGYSGGAGSTSSNKFANGSNQNCGNMITDRSSTRIHAPPGGHSSISFG